MNQERAAARAASDSDGPAGLNAGLPHAYSFWLPADLPARSFPWQLAFWFEPQTDSDFEVSAARRSGTRAPAHWLSLELNRDPATPTRARLADLARRVVLAKAVNPDRLFVPAPFGLSDSGGGPAWQPTDEYIPLRTLFHHLSGRRAVAALRLGGHAVGVLFRGEGGAALVVWTWRAEAPETTAELYLGNEAYVVELSGATRALDHDGLLAQIPLAPVPLIIENVDAALLLLQHSFRIAPAAIQLHEPQPQPLLTLQNHFQTELTGTLTLHPPPDWQLTPSPIPIRLAPGQRLAQKLGLTIPPRQVAAAQLIGVELELWQPRAVKLRFDAPLRIELRDILVETTAWWNGPELVVEQVLRNRSSDPVSFSAFCQVTERALREGVFLDVPPGARRAQTYRFPAARELAGDVAWAGIQEIVGPRALDQVVEIPP